MITIDRDFATPNGPAVLDSDRWIGCADSNAAHITEAIMHAFEYTGAIVAPLIVIIAADKIGGGRPAFVFNSAEKIFGMTSNLTLRLPEPDQKRPE